MFIINGKRQIGHFSQKVIDLLNLSVKAGTPIYIGENNIEHIKNDILMNLINIFRTSKKYWRPRITSAKALKTNLLPM